MTDPVKGISGSQGASAGGSYSGGGYSGHHHKKGAAAPQDDLIEISPAARKQAKGTTKKSLLEYLKELFG